MRKPVMAGNWKMYKTRGEARSFVEALKPLVADASHCEVVLCAPFTAVAALAEAVSGTNIAAGAQDLHWEKEGAFTGEVSAGMVVEAGATHVIIGHSERRQYFGETDETVNKKLKAALAAGLAPIVCVGETLEQREAGSTLDIIAHQVHGGLCELPIEMHTRVIVAYEPVWAIGTGRTATPEQAEEVHAEIRRLLADCLSPQAAEQVRVLYGGSVKPDNIDALMRCPNVDGALVGGASLKADDFLRIVHFTEH